MPRHRIVGVCVLGFLLVRAPDAAAETPAEREAFDLYNQAKEDIAASRFDVALAKLNRAYQLFPMPHILVRKAEALVGLEDLEQALQVLKSVQTTDRKLKARVAELTARVLQQLNEPVEVQVVLNVRDVELIVDGVEKYLAPCTVRLTRGRHRFEFRKQGYEPVTMDHEVAGPRTRTVSATLAEQMGRVVFRTDLPSFEGIVIRLDDRELVPHGSSASPSRTDGLLVPAGPHKLLCVREGSAPFIGQFEVAANRTVEVLCALRGEAAPVNRTWGYLMLGGGGAMVAAGVGLVAWYYVRRGQKPAEDPAGNAYVFRDRHENIAGFVLLGVGAATAAASYFFLARDAPARSSLQTQGIGLAPADGGAVAVWRGVF